MALSAKVEVAATSYGPRRSGKMRRRFVPPMTAVLMVMVWSVA
jgi:hypothetical protein